MNNVRIQDDEEAKTDNFEKSNAKQLDNVKQYERL